MQFWKYNDKDILVSFDSKSELKAMTLAYTAQLGLKVQKTDVNAQKIDRSSLAIYSMFIVIFQIFNKLGRSRFFQEIFLQVNISIKVVLNILILIFSNIHV